MRRHKIQSYAILFFLFSALAVTFATGCTDKQLEQAATLSRDFRLAVGAIQNVEIEFYNAHRVDNATHVSIQQGIVDLSNAGDEVNNAIRVARSKPSAIEALDRALGATQRLIDNGAAHVKDEDVKNSLNAAILAVRTILNSAKAALQ